MRRIRKLPEPERLIEWKRRYPNQGFPDLSGEHKAALRGTLLVEQGGLCAYTGLRIDGGSFHIDHLRPQAWCGPGMSVDHSNMVASFPNGNAPSPGFGGKAKKDWPSSEEEMAYFVTPLLPECESAFVYLQASGKVRPADPNSPAARETLQRLGLNHPKLVKLRLNAISGVLVPRGEEASVETLQERLKELEGQEAVGAGDLEEFSFVLIAVLRTLLSPSPPPSIPPDGCGE